MLEGLPAKALNHVGHTSWCAFRVITVDKSCRWPLYLFQAVDFFIMVGSQTVEEYSSLGRTMVVYTAVFTEVEQSLRFRRTNPRVLLALFTVSSMCFLQVRSSLMVTPKYLLLSTTSSVCPWI